MTTAAPRKAYRSDLSDAQWHRRLDRFLEESQKSYRAFVRVFFVKPYSDFLF